MARHWTFGSWIFDEETHRLSGPQGDESLEPRVADLLSVFLQHPGEVLSHDFLIETVWQGRIVSDEAVRRAVSNLRRALSADGTDVLIKTVHKKGYVSHYVPRNPSDPVRLSSPAAPEATPRQDRQGIRERPRYAWLSALVLGAALLAVLSTYSWWQTGGAVEELPATVLLDGEQPIPLAVLPFRNLVPDSNDNTLPDGMAEELISRLGRLNAFRVTARSSSFNFRGDDVNLRQAGRDLGVRYLVEGSVRREAGQLRVSAALVDVRSGFQVWADSYDRDSVAGLFGVQEDIAREVARALQVVLVSDAPRRAAPDPRRVQAQLAYTRARQRMESWVQGDVEAAMVDLRSAIELDPDFAPAYVQLARALEMHASNDQASNWEATREAARSLVDKALALDPSLGEAYVQRAGLSPKRQLGQMEADLRKGLKLSPSYSWGFNQLAQLLFFEKGDKQEALAMIDQAIALDPLSPRNYHIKSYFEILQCRLEEAAALSEQSLSIDPRFRSALLQLARVSHLRGELAEALRYLERAREIDPDTTWLRTELAYTFLALGQEERARAMNNPPAPETSLLLLAAAGDEAALAAALFTYNEDDLQYLWPQHAANYAYRAARVTGDYPRSIRLLETLYPTWSEPGGPRSAAPWHVYQKQLPAYLFLVLLREGAGESAEDIRAELDDLARRYQQIRVDGLACKGYGLPQATALLALHRGDKRGALAELRYGVVNGELTLGDWPLLRSDPAFAPLQSEAGFTALVAEAEQQAAAQWALYNADPDVAGELASSQSLARLAQ